jgi:hypothetical protein
MEDGLKGGAVGKWGLIQTQNRQHQFDTDVIRNIHITYTHTTSCVIDARRQCNCIVHVNLQCLSSSVSNIPRGSWGGTKNGVM